MEHLHAIVDDTFITLRYARNWVEGLGLVYNPGERVEGYTNFLWMTLLAGLMKLNLNGVAASRYVGVLFALGTLFLVTQFSRLVSGQSKPGDLIAASLISLNGSMAYWGGSGMENSLFVFLAFSGQILFLRKVDNPSIKRGLMWGFVFALTTLTRPDGGLFFAAALMLRILVYREGDRGLRWKEAISAGIVFSIPLAIHMLFRLSYYGEWLPNTFYAKAGIGWGRLWWGLVYAWDYFDQYSLLLAVPVLILFASKPEQRRELSLLVFGGVYFLYVISIGGDRVFAYFRFFVVILPNIYLLSGHGFEAIWEIIAERTSNVRAGAGIVIYLLFLFGISINASFSGPQYNGFKDGNKILTNATQIGGFLKKNFPPDTWMAISRCGAIPYYSGLPTIDMLGLNDKHIARNPTSGLERLPGHQKHDFRYVLDRKPVIIFYWDKIFDSPPENLGFHRVLSAFIGFQELADSEVRGRFEREYSFRIARVNKGYICFFLRNEFLEKLSIPSPK